jgi:hypothetical protein
MWAYTNTKNIFYDESFQITKIYGFERYLQWDPYSRTAFPDYLLYITTLKDFIPKTDVRKWVKTENGNFLSISMLSYAFNF